MPRRLALPRLMRHSRDQLSAAVAQEFIRGSTFAWHQSFELASGVKTPGRNPMEELFEHARIPLDLTGKSALDIGTTNGGGAFLLERRGAARVVAVDIVDEEHYGFSALRDLLGSRAEFVQTNAYELADALNGERFDVVLYWGVIYHLRHPLLGLDALRQVVAGDAWIESQVADGELGDGRATLNAALFYRRGELYGDPSNWWVPTISALLDMCGSCGFDSQLVTAWPRKRLHRAMIHATPASGVPEYAQNEAPIRVVSA